MTQAPILLLLFFLQVSCHERPPKFEEPSKDQFPKTDSLPASTDKMITATTAYDTSGRSTKGLKSIFRIEKKKGNGIFLQLYVYLSDISKVKLITAYFKSQYAGEYTQAFDIWYFDKQNLVDRYLRAVDDHSLSDATFAALDKHRICQYSWAGSGNGIFDYNSHDGNK